jgi:hypothetical protein
MVLGGVGHAALVSSTGVIKACVIPTTGGAQANTRIIDEADTCASGQTGLQWNQTGPGGPTGPAGPVGPAGPAGPAGSDGSSGSGGTGVVSSTDKPTKVEIDASKKMKKKKIVFGRTNPQAERVKTGKRVVVTALSGPVINLSAPYPYMRRRGKVAFIACPHDAPVLLSYTAPTIEGGGGTFSFNDHSYEEGGRGKAIRTASQIWIPPGPEPPLSELEAYVFELRGECADV